MTVRARMTPLAAGVLGTVLALVAAHGRSTPYDNYVLLAFQLLHGHLWIDPLWSGPAIDAVLFDGHRYIVNDPVPSLLLLPFVLAFGLHANQTFVAALLCGVACGAAWSLLGRIGVRERVAWWLLAFLLLGTDLLWCSMLGDVWFIAQTSALAFLMLALDELAGPRRPWLVALWFALSVGSRFTVVMATPVLLWWVFDGFLERLPRRDARALLTACATLLPFAALWTAYNVARWHVPWDAGHTVFYHEDPYVGSSTGSPFSLANVPMQIRSFFVQPPEWRATAPYLIPSLSGTALWFTSPALALALFARGPRRLLASLWIAAVLVAGPSFLYYVNGSAQFGMRHLLDFLPFLFVLMALAARDTLALAWRILIVWSAAAGAWGIWYWNAFVRPGTM